MKAKFDTRDAAPTGSNQPALRRGRDVRKDAQDDTDAQHDQEDSQLRRPTHGVGAFLWELPPDTPIDELGERYRKWKRNGSEEGSQ